MTDSASKTLFQKILDKEIPADIVFEDELCGAFRDINPQAPTHILIVPRKPMPGISAMTPEDKALIGHLFHVAAQLARDLDLAQGYRLVINDGAHGGQEVPHLHIHLLGGRPLTWPPG